MSCQRCHVSYNSTVPSSSPYNITVTSINPASLGVSWDPPLEMHHNGPITGYMIQYTRVGSSDMMSVNVTSGTTHTISGLAVLIQHSVIVAAMTVNGTGPFSSPPVVGRSGEYGEIKTWLLAMYYEVVSMLIFHITVTDVANNIFIAEILQACMQSVDYITKCKTKQHTV